MNELTYNFEFHQRQKQKIDFLSFHVNFFLILICKKLKLNFFDFSSYFLLKMINDANIKTSFTRSFKICRKISSKFLFFFHQDMLTKNNESFWINETMNHNHKTQIHKTRRCCKFLSWYDYSHFEMSLLSNHEKQWFNKRFESECICQVLFLVMIAS